MSLGFGSINTGLPKDIVQQIIKAERIPIDKMEERKSKVVTKKGLIEDILKRVTALKTKLLENSSKRSLREVKTSGNEKLVSLTADKNIVEPGSYRFEVLELAQKSSAMSSSFEDPKDSYIGVGYIQYMLPSGEKKDIYIDRENSSLDKMAKLINRNEEIGIRANVINDGRGKDDSWRMIISLRETGDERQAEFPNFYFIDGEEDFFLEFERKAKDAKIKLDGFEIELPKNTTSEIIPGLTIDLKNSSPGEEFTISISEDAGAVKDKITGMIEELNSILSFIKEQNTIDESTDTSKTLGGDILLQSLESRIRNTIFKDIKTALGSFRVGDLGLSFLRNGSLKFDADKFESMVSKNYKQASEILTGRFNEDGTKENGFIDNMSETVTNLLRFPDGLLPSRKRSLESKISGIDRRIQQRERMLSIKEKNLKNKFARLEGTISRIKAQGAGIQGLAGGAQL